MSAGWLRIESIEVAIHYLHNAMLRRKKFALKEFLVRNYINERVFAFT